MTGVQTCALPIYIGMLSKGFGNVPFKDLTMERKRVEEFEEFLCEDCA